MGLSAIVNQRQIVIGALVLLAGVLAYVASRAPDTVYFIGFLPVWPNAYGSVSGFPTMFRNNFPTFAHTLALSTITGSLCVPARRSYTVASLSWLAIEVLFELGQGPWRSLVVFVLADRSDDGLITSIVRTYFALGTFDVGDIAAACLGSAAGFAILMLTRERAKGTSHHDRQL